LENNKLIEVPDSEIVVNDTLRKKAAFLGHKVVVPIVSYYDDFSKGWGDLYCQLAGLQWQYRNLQENIHLVALVPPGITSLEAIQHHVLEIQQLESGIFMWHSVFQEEVLVIDGLYCLLADMPQANMFCNCKKLNADYACHCCAIHRSKQNIVEETAPARSKEQTKDFIQKVKDGLLMEKDGAGLKVVENALLHVKHFDPHKDIPVELLH
jgi:hypothetical protein